MNSRLLSTRLVRWLESRRLLHVSAGALLRVLGWFAVTMVVVASVVGDVEFAPYSTYNTSIDTPAVRDVGAQRGDERGFGDPADDDHFRVAWIAGSSIQGVEPTNQQFLPDEVVKVLPEIDGRPVAVDMYFLSGMRTLDAYAAVLTAVEDDPDMIVLTLNPMWALNDRAIQGWDNLDARLIEHLWDDPSRWAMLASLTSPGDALWAAVNGFDVFDDRYHWGLRITDRFGGSSLLELGPPPEEAGEPSELERIAAMQIPVIFWDRYANIVEDGLVGSDRHAARFEYINEADSALNEQAVTGMLRAVSQSEIPAYAYVAQFSEEDLLDPAVDQAFDEVEARLAELGAPYEGGTMTFEPESVVRLVDGLDFRDPIHIFDVTPIRDHLVVELCEVIAASGWSSSCEEAS